MKNKVTIISSVHRWDDTRIFHRQATSLAKKFQVDLHAPAGFDLKELNGVKIVGLAKWKRKRDRIKLWFIIFKRVIKSKAEIVHFHDPELMPLGLAIKLFSRKKVIFDVHEHIVYDIEDKEWIPNYLRYFILNALMLMEKICVPKFDAVIYTTPIVGERYLKLSRNAISIENYSKLDTFFEKKETNSIKKGNTVIYLGRVLNVRGLEQVIKAFKQVIRKIPDANLLIVGDIVPDSYEKELKALPRMLELDKNIHFTGFVPHIETIRYLRMASCGIVTLLPTKENKACLPNKLFEYMASGLPVIASNFDLYKQVVEGSECGVTVDPENIEMISDAIVSMLRDPNVGSTLGMNGKKAFETKYNWEQEELKLFKLYDHLLGV